MEQTAVYQTKPKTWMLSDAYAVEAHGDGCIRIYALAANENAPSILLQKEEARELVFALSETLMGELRQDLVRIKGREIDKVLDGGTTKRKALQSKWMVDGMTIAFEAVREHLRFRGAFPTVLENILSQPLFTMRERPILASIMKEAAKSRHGRDKAKKY